MAYRKAQARTSAPMACAKPLSPESYQKAVRKDVEGKIGGIGKGL